MVLVASSDREISYALDWTNNVFPIYAHQLVAEMKLVRTVGVYSLIYSHEPVLIKVAGRDQVHQ